jgi:hypothetical protein
MAWRVRRGPIVRRAVVVEGESEWIALASGWEKRVKKTNKP